MPFVKVWVHYVWTTKNRQPLIADEFRHLVFDHIRENARIKEIYLDCIGGYREHAHCLVSLGIEQTIGNTAKLLKGESSHWINQQGFCKTKFRWQHEYFAVGVCESIIDKTRAYIQRQELHHRTKPFDGEFDTMIRKYGFQRYRDDDA
jgi:REP element-mobilizing transposase RayT